MDDRHHRVLSPVPVDPTCGDVLCGAGHETTYHPGNIQFRRIVSQHFYKYLTATCKKAKIRVSRAILTEVLSTGARFLKRNNERTHWHVAHVKVGKDKISHSLRLLKASHLTNDRRNTTSDGGCCWPVNGNVDDVDSTHYSSTDSQQERQQQQHRQQQQQQQQPYSDSSCTNSHTTEHDVHTQQQQEESNRIDNGQSQKIGTPTSFGIDHSMDDEYSTRGQYHHHHHPDSKEVYKPVPLLLRTATSSSSPVIVPEDESSFSSRAGPSQTISSRTTNDEGIAAHRHAYYTEQPQQHERSSSQSPRFWNYPSQAPCTFSSEANALGYPTTGAFSHVKTTQQSRGDDCSNGWTDGSSGNGSSTHRQQQGRRRRQQQHGERSNNTVSSSDTFRENSHYNKNHPYSSDATSPPEIEPSPPSSSHGVAESEHFHPQGEGAATYDHNYHRPYRQYDSHQPITEENEHGSVSTEQHGSEQYERSTTCRGTTSAAYSVPQHHHHQVPKRGDWNHGSSYPERRDLHTRRPVATTHDASFDRPAKHQQEVTGRGDAQHHAYYRDKHHSSSSRRGDIEASTLVHNNNIYHSESSYNRDKGRPSSLSRRRRDDNGMYAYSSSNHTTHGHHETYASYNSYPSSSVSHHPPAYPSHDYYNIYNGYPPYHHQHQYNYNSNTPPHYYPPPPTPLDVHVSNGNSARRSRTLLPSADPITVWDDGWDDPNHHNTTTRSNDAARDRNSRHYDEECRRQEQQPSWDLRRTTTSWEES